MGYRLRQERNLHKWQMLPVAPRGDENEESLQRTMKECVWIDFRACACSEYDFFSARLFGPMSDSLINKRAMWQTGATLKREETNTGTTMLRGAGRDHRLTPRISTCTPRDKIESNKRLKCVNKQKWMHKGYGSHNPRVCFRQIIGIDAAKFHRLLRKKTTWRSVVVLRTKTPPHAKAIQRDVVPPDVHPTFMLIIEVP